MKLPVKGTEILFQKENKWYNMDSNGIIVPTNTYEYIKRYQKQNSLVVINDIDDNKYISDLNDGEFTVVVDKFKINRPNLKTFEFTTEWMSLDHFLKLKKLTDNFCMIAKTFNIPPKNG